MRSLFPYTNRERLCFVSWEKVRLYVLNKRLKIAFFIGHLCSFVYSTPQQGQKCQVGDVCVCVTWCVYA